MNISIYLDATYIPKKYPSLTLKLPGEGQMALPLNLNEKNIPNADFFLGILNLYIFFDKV